MFTICEQKQGLPIDKVWLKWFYECMKAKRKENSSRIKIIADLNEATVAAVNEGNMDAVLVSRRPVVNSGLKGLIKEVFQFVSVGGDFT